jgi:transcriptional regulator with XRE-family HTH domain
MSTPLGEFLQARRAQLSPADLGMPTPDEPRRVPGLRREELALLAGVSASYYARLEQGTSRNASPEVLDAIAGALNFGPVERAHLHELAKHRRSDHPDDGPEQLAPPLSELLPALGDVPALALGRSLDVLAWNPLGHALVGGHLDRSAVEAPGDRPNNALSVFLDPDTAALYTDWPRKARAIVGHLRTAAARYPRDGRLASVIGRLSMRSEEFARLWADHTVAACEGGSYELNHPLVGPFIVHQQTLNPIGASDQSLVTFTVPDGSGALDLLRHLVARRRPGSLEQ